MLWWVWEKGKPEENREKAQQRGIQSCQGEDGDNQGRFGVLLDGAVPTCLAGTLASRDAGVALAANTCEAGPGKTKGRCGMEGEGLAGSAGSLSPALFAPRLTRACKMRKSKENQGWVGMIGGLSPLPPAGWPRTPGGLGFKVQAIAG